ncbi:uncharacterized protein LOC116180770 [Photinus pyralis]|uniref:uncharacterized protein LOC116180770 n=1 Tax=Photinus pyralis TaxID=7054 RepID=UPI0012677DA5|nr:uncharacterized protein LOC116180770 [Photinus pyralis]
MKMFTLLAILVSITPPCLNSQCRILFEDLEIDGLDERHAMIVGAVYEVKGSAQNRANVTFLWKKELPEGTKIRVKATRWAKNDYKFLIFNIERPMRSFLEMNAFGIYELCHEQVRPPAVWPLKTNTLYRLTGFYMDGSKIPPNLPDGKWRVTQSISLPNRSIIANMTWKVRMDYV